MSKTFYQESSNSLSEFSKGLLFFFKIEYYFLLDSLLLIFQLYFCELIAEAYFSAEHSIQHQDQNLGKFI